MLKRLGILARIDLKYEIFLFILGATVLFCINTNAQKIKERQFDKFIKEETISTYTETLYTRFSYQFKFHIKKIGTHSYTIFAKISTPKCEKYSDDSGVSLLLSNGDVINLHTSYTGISGLSYTSQSYNIYTFETAFILSNEDILKLKEFDITDIRVPLLIAITI